MIQILPSPSLVPKYLRKGRKREKKLLRQIEGTARYAPSTPARDRRPVASYTLNQVVFLKIIKMNVTLITLITGEILRAKLAREQRKGKKRMGREDISVALKTVAKEAAKKAAKETAKELKKKKKK